MFSEKEIDTLLQIEPIANGVAEKRKRFLLAEAPYMEISEHDFLSLIIMTPAVGICLSNGSVSLFEELALNKMARKMSKGGFFMKKDPVAHAMKYLIKSFENWEDEFYEVISSCIENTCNLELCEKVSVELPAYDLDYFARELMKMPYGFVSMLSTMIINEEADIVEIRPISSHEFEKIKDIGKRMKFYDLPIFKAFLSTFEVRN